MYTHSSILVDILCVYCTVYNALGAGNVVLDGLESGVEYQVQVVMDTDVGSLQTQWITGEMGETFF